ncbi:hypothetical protein [Priestia taiwanensis]|uniref:Uncharacterized protein n=1 Tax=Priestia taiwanensis TaxID=1347902 RepID=A0A917ATR5_9BACI|nr:hypothetical protein [Priestia taiwanensis]MBM7363877.1 cytochrome b subunit of formate dehydrogenase [Priestia taiwanensis]GGE69733.1 hypothetical protein GCM10007140_19700 [Priestia taiwanensis]
MKEIIQPYILGFVLVLVGIALMFLSFVFASSIILWSITLGISIVCNITGIVLLIKRVLSIPQDE